MKVVGFAAVISNYITKMQNPGNSSMLYFQSKLKRLGETHKEKQGCALRKIEGSPVL